MKPEVLKKFLRLVVICLAFVCIDKAAGSLSPDSDSHSAVSETLNTASHQFHPNSFAFSTAETQCRVPRNSNFANSLRPFAKTLRQNSTSQTRNGFALIKSGKSMNDYSTSLFIVSMLNFPSGMNESTHHLISLGKLII